MKRMTLLFLALVLLVAAGCGPKLTPATTPSGPVCLKCLSKGSG